MANGREVHRADNSTAKKKFDEHLDKASETVASWPEWKREISSSYTNPVPGEQKPKSKHVSEK